jgi:hypothetical protein
MAVNQSAYQSSIRGDHLKVFRTYFPLSEMLAPPESWRLDVTSPSRSLPPPSPAPSTAKV